MGEELDQLLARHPVLDAGRLQLVLEAWAAQVPGWFLYFPSRAQRSAPLRAFAEVAREVLLAGRP